MTSGPIFLGPIFLSNLASWSPPFWPAGSGPNGPVGPPPFWPAPPGRKKQAGSFQLGRPAPLSTERGRKGDGSPPSVWGPSPSPPRAPSWPDGRGLLSETNRKKKAATGWAMMEDYHIGLRQAYSHQACSLFSSSPIGSVARKNTIRAP